MRLNISETVQDTDTSAPRDKDMKGSTWVSEGPRARSHEAEDRLEGMAEESFSTPLGRTAFLVLLRFLACYSAKPSCEPILSENKCSLLFLITSPGDVTKDNIADDPH